MTTPDVNVVLLDFPNLKKEMVVPNEDGSFTIMINAKHSVEQQAAAYEHAMKHIQNQDFQRKDVQRIEHAAHNLAVPVVSSKAKKGSEDVLENILKRIRKDRRKLRKQIEEYENDMKFISSFSGSDTIQKSEEKKWLYDGVY
ncbi:hypothetical protein B5F29_02440 [Lachnoclostridium sp. An196]|uniref:hypothetical protein n=1 Tax=Lachnoclostridium sp. An196 TaxID=1965583 RepID=UPI000B3AC633|nr:hypothetical protein [Lachnoclostridium sp. An196]OUP21358.1 hypothetical protein B5F29_02440 [Lachnoclostridium sp. An196]